jgi:ankyrin repeat protein
MTPSLVEAAASGDDALVTSGDDALVSLLLAENSVTQADESGLTPLMAAALAGHAAAVHSLCCAGAPITAKDGAGLTALHAACRSSSVDCVMELLRVGARTDVRDEAGLVPLDHLDVAAPHYAALREALESARTLEEAINSGAADDSGCVSAAAAVDYDSEYSWKSYDSAQDDRPWH